MSSVDSVLRASLGSGWLLLLAFTVSVLCVAVLRKPFRRWFGAERAFQLWLLPPLAMLASQLPHIAAPVSTLPPVIVTVVTAASSLPLHDASLPVTDWRMWAVLLWLTGMAISLALAALAQSRYRTRLRNAKTCDDTSSRWPILHAADTDIGPALVGAWRPRIVLPADFHSRYDTVEQTLILAHEARHASRRDGWWCLLARIGAATFWFYPLAWWALSALRRDQELACDAAVLREHATQRRSYANAMLKTQPATFALPVGCAWSPRHPLTERIAMLMQSQPSRFRRTSGAAFAIAISLFGAGCVYAATSPAATSKTTTVTNYKLKLALTINGDARFLHATMCIKPGENYDVTETNIGDLPPWHGSFTVVSEEKGLLEVRTKMSGGPLKSPESPYVRTYPGQKAVIRVGEIVEGQHGAPPKDHTINIDLTPSVGC